MSTTPFEDSGKLTLTTLAEEATFVSALVAANPGTVTYEVVGQSIELRDIYALRFGTPGNRPVLLLTTVHGDENVPREAALTLARDLCETTPSAAVQALLAERELIIIPTPNPDGFPNDRGNSNADDMNRHYLDVTVPETALLVDFIYTEDPIAVMDGHEWNGYTSDGTAVGNSAFASVDPAIRQASIDIAEAIMAALTADSVTTQWYPRDTPAQTCAHLCAEVGIIPTLMETTCEWATITTGRPDRHDWHRLAMAAWLEHLSANAATWETTSTEARARAAAKVGRTDTFRTFDMQAPLHVGGTVTGEAVSVVSYTIASEDIATVSDALDAHGITYDGGTGVVSMAQERAQIAALLLDPLSDSALVSATRVAPDPAVADPLPTAAYQLWSSVV